MSRSLTPPWAARVLVADDDAEMRALLVDLLEEAGCAVVDACDGEEASRRLQVDSDPWQYELVITDYRMPGLDGLELARALKGEQGAPPIVLMSAFLDSELAAKAVRAGASAMLPKPFPVERLLGLVRSMIGPL